jgi:hypothetical protein
MLTAWLCPRDRVVRCSPWPDLDDDRVADALLDALEAAA